MATDARQYFHHQAMVYYVKLAHFNDNGDLLSNLLIPIQQRGHRIRIPLLFHAGRRHCRLAMTICKYGSQPAQTYAMVKWCSSSKTVALFQLFRQIDHWTMDETQNQTVFLSSIANGNTGEMMSSHSCDLVVLRINLQRHG